MKNNVIDKRLIESIVRSNNDEYVEKVNEKVNLLVANAINDLSKSISYVNLDNVIFQPVNELLTGGFTDNSKFVYFLGIDNAQLELNTVKTTTFWRDLKNKIVDAWKNRNTRRAKRKRRKKAKKEAEIAITESPEFNFDPSKYNIYKLCEDLQTAIANYADLTSIIYLEKDRLRLIGKDDFGSNTQILIYPVIFNGEVFKYYAGRQKGFIEVDIFARAEALNQKYEQVGDNFTDIIKIFNVLYFYANKVMPNQVFIESLLYSCPNELFKGEDIYTVFVKIINYLTMSSIKDIPSLNNREKTIFLDKISASSGLGYEKFINQFIYLNQKEISTKRPDIKKDKKLNKIVKSDKVTEIENNENKKENDKKD